MKAEVTVVPTEEVFVPFGIKLIFESEQEVNEFFALFNHSPILYTVPALSGDKLREVIHKAVGKTPEYSKALEVINAGWLKKKQ